MYGNFLVYGLACLVQYKCAGVISHLSTFISIKIYRFGQFSSFIEHLRLFYNNLFKGSVAMNTIDTCPRICIVGSDQLQYDLLSFCLNNELNAQCVFNDEVSSAGDGQSFGVKVWLFDCLEYNSAELEKQIKKYVSEPSQDNLIALFNVTPEHSLARFIKRNKIRGVFYRNDSREVFLKGIRTLLNGRLWLSRKMLSDCILLADEHTNAPAQEINILSCREKDILQNVALGASNQEIADNLEISVHTVKTHLYKIYRKIDVPNRLQATLWANACL